MKSPENISELRHFLGMVNQLGKFAPQLATITQPLCELLTKWCSWCWTVNQEEALTMICHVPGKSLCTADTLSNLTQSTLGGRQWKCVVLSKGTRDL